jgi:hypothetical protein
MILQRRAVVVCLAATVATAAAFNLKGECEETTRKMLSACLVFPQRYLAPVFLLLSEIFDECNFLDLPLSTTSSSNDNVIMSATMRWSLFTHRRRLKWLEPTIHFSLTLPQIKPLLG